MFGESIWVECVHDFLYLNRKLTSQLRIEVVEPGRPHSIDDLLLSSSINIMPDMSSHSPVSVVSHPRGTPIVDLGNVSDDDVSDSSSVSMVSIPSSDDEDDAALWADSRTQATAGYVPEAMEYVLLYDDNTSDED